MQIFQGRNLSSTSCRNVMMQHRNAAMVARPEQLILLDPAKGHMTRDDDHLIDEGAQPSR